MNYQSFKKAFIIYGFIILMFSCKSIPTGVYEGYVSDSILSSGEYPVEYFEFDKNREFKHYEIFCFLTFYGEGKYKIKGDKIYLKYGNHLDPSSYNVLISDTITMIKLTIHKDSLLLGKDIFHKK